MSFISQRRDLALVISARAVSMLGDEVAAVALLLRLQGNGAGPASVAALLIAALAPVVLLAHPVGHLVDRRDNRALLVASSTGQAALCAALAFAHGTPAVLVLVALLGAGEAVNSTAWQALLPGITGPEGLPRALGISRTSMTAAGVLAPALGGFLTGWFGTRVPLLLDAVTFFAITVAALLVRVRRTVAGQTEDDRARGGFAIVAADPLLRVTLVMLALFITLGAAVNVVDVFLVRETLHASAAWYGAVGALFFVGLAVGSLLAGRWRGMAAMARALVASSACLSIGVAGWALVPSVWWLALPVLATGAANGVLNVSAGALVMLRATEAERGRVGAVTGAVASGSQIGAYALAGAVAGIATPREVFLVAGLAGLIAPVAFGRRLLQTAREASTEELRDDDRCEPSYSLGDSRDGVDSARVRP